MADQIKATNITWHHETVSLPIGKKEYHGAALLWFTGLSCQAIHIAQALQAVLLNMAARPMCLMVIISDMA